MRAIALVDLDAFYTQVEAQRNPVLQNIPMAVMQYNPFGDLATHRAEEERIMNDSNGTLIAVNYEARARGVKRNMRGDEARALCPNLQLVQVPTAHGKADLTIYCAQGAKVLACMAEYGTTERASIDEMYIDCTEQATRRLQENGGHPPLPQRLEQMHIADLHPNDPDMLRSWFLRPPSDWQEGERLLAAAAGVIADARAAVEASLGYTCSAGIAHTKILAKLAAGLHKPRAQTLVPAHAVAPLLRELPIPKLRNLGGQFGEEVMRTLGITTVGQLAAVSIARLSACFKEDDAQWLYDMARGVDHEKVKPRALPKSSGCGKTFFGANKLKTFEEVLYWLKQLGKEVEERLDMERADNSRRPTLMTAGFTVHVGGQEQHLSRSAAIRKCEGEVLAEDAYGLVRKAVGKASGWAITNLYLGTTNFENIQSSTLQQFFNGSGAAAGPAAAAGPSKPAGEAQQDLVLSKVDPEVLAELPEDVRAEVLREMQQRVAKSKPKTKPQQCSTTRFDTKPIASFFKPK